MESQLPSSGKHQKANLEGDERDEMNKEMEEDTLLEGSVLGGSNKEGLPQDGPSFVLPLHADLRMLAAAAGQTSLKPPIGTMKQQLKASRKPGLVVGAAEAGAMDTSRTTNKSDHIKAPAMVQTANAVTKRTSERNRASADQNTLERAERLTARKNLEPYEAGDTVNGKKRQQQKKKHVGKNSGPDLQPPCKMKRTNDSRSQLQVGGAMANNVHVCQNSSCGAALNPGENFCRCCSCCICFKYDDSKDPSLWLSCTSDESVQGDSCGMSCHLECALKDERSGVLQSGQSNKLDGAYYCTHCGKQNDLLGCWKKQLLMAKNAQRLDELWFRIFLSHKILVSTKKYSLLHSIVDTAMTKLKAKFGPVIGILNVSHETVCEVPVALEVQTLCACALYSHQTLFSGSLTADLETQKRRSKDSGNKDGLLLTNSSDLIPVNNSSDLIPVTNSSDLIPVTNSSHLISVIKTSLGLDSSKLIVDKSSAYDAQLENGSGSQTENGINGSVVPKTANGINGTSAQPDSQMLGTGTSKPASEPGNSSNETTVKLVAVMSSKDKASEEKLFDYCVKVVRWLEHEGHIEANFRMKFWTWFCLRATIYQKRTVGDFVARLIADPVSLAGKLVDTFSDTIYSRS